MVDQQETSTRSPRSFNLFWAVAGMAVGGAVVVLSFVVLWGREYIGWMLLAGGLALLSVGAWRCLSDSDRRDAVAAWLRRLSMGAVLFWLGSLLILIGLIARFGPRDVSIVLAGVGGLLFIGALVWFVRERIAAGRARLGVPEPTAVGESTRQTVNSLGPEEFRRRAQEVVFQVARRNSLMNLIVALAFFIFGLTLLGFLCFGIHELSTGSSLRMGMIHGFARELNAFMNPPPDAPDAPNAPDEPDEGPGLTGLLTALAPLILFDLGPVLTLAFVAILAIIVTNTAIGLSQRRVVQSSLEELGPLQAILAGIPPRKPMSQTFEKTLAQAGRAFTARLWLSYILIVVGLGLLGFAVWNACCTGTQDIVESLAAGGSGITAFIISLFVNRHKEIRDTLREVSEKTVEVAGHAHRAEIIDRYVSQVMQSDAGMDAESLRAVLALIEAEQQGEEEGDGADNGAE